MVFGIGEGKIDIKLDRHTFSPGDTIKGTVSLKVNKPVNARQLRLVFAGEKIIRESVRNSQSGRSTRARREFIHRFEIPLDGEKEYANGDYVFEIPLPANVPSKDPERGGILGGVMKAVDILNSLTTRIEWYLEASLDMPKSFDIKKKVKINVIRYKKEG